MQNFGQILLGVPDLDALNLRAELMAPFSLQLCACAVQQEIKPTYLHPGQGQKHPISDPLQPRAQVQHPGSPRAVLLPAGDSACTTRYFSPSSRALHAELVRWLVDPASSSRALLCSCARKFNTAPGTADQPATSTLPSRGLVDRMICVA